MNLDGGAVPVGSESPAVLPSSVVAPAGSGVPNPGAMPGDAISGVFGGATWGFTRQATAVFLASEDRTVISGEFDSDDFETGGTVRVSFAGSSVGIHSCGAGNDGALNVSITFGFDDGQRAASYSTSNADVAPCTIVVDEYGAVGERVVGSFTGSLVATARSGPEGGMPPMTIQASGEFNLERSIDLP